MVTLTLSGNEITDAVRAAGLQGDGSDPEGSMGIWEATTNLFGNGGFETNANGWGTDGGGSALARITSDSKFGSACGRWTNASGPQGVYRSATLSATTVYTFSAWLKNNGGTTTARLRVRSSGGAIDTGANFTLTDEWTRCSITFTSHATELSHAHYIQGSGGSGYDCLIDGAQLEQQPIATPYVETDGGTASRSASRVQFPVAGVLDETQGWVAVRRRFNGNTGSGTPRPFSWWDSINDRLSLGHSQSGTDYYMQRNSGGAGAGAQKTIGAPSAGSVQTLIGFWSATQCGVSTNGSVFTTNGNTAIPTISATSADIGSGGAVAALDHVDSDILWFACGLGTLSDADAAAIHANGNANPSPYLFPDAAELTMIWAAEDSYARSNFDVYNSGFKFGFR
jgi:hypothetical protein